MFVNLSLTAKMRILVFAPLVIQLFFLSYLFTLQRNSEAALSKTQKAHQITELVNRLTRDIYQSSAMFADPKALENWDKDSPNFETVKENIERDGEKLKELTRDDPAQYAETCKAKQLYLDALKVLQALQRETIDPSLAITNRIELYKILRSRCKQMVACGLKIEQTQREVAATSSESATNLRNLLHKTALAMAAFYLIAAGLLAFFFSKNISDRLRLLNDNAYRLASDLPLNRVLRGNDEITQVDQTFHRMARAMRESARKERAIIEKARDMICSIDATGKVTAVNPACEAVVGYKQSELLGSHFGDLISEGTERAATFLGEVRKLGDMGAVEMSLRRKGGEAVYGLLSSHWAEDEEAAFIVIHDISDRKKAELLRREIVAMITHDLRTPLTTFGTVMKFLASGEFGQLNQKGNEYLTIGTRNVKRMSSLVNDMLDIEKIESGEMKVDWSRVSLDEALEECLDSIGPLADASAVKVHVAPAPYIVAADYEKLQRILVNLLANAIKFSPAGKDIEVAAARQGEFITVSVQDHGPGIAADQLDQVFKRFKQAEHQSEAVANAATGSGLGLTICKAFVELQGGTISVESSKGAGARFTFTIPVSAPPGT